MSQSRQTTVSPDLYRQIFEVDKRGAALLEDLIKRFSQPAVTDGGIDAVLKTYERMGSTKVVQFIVGQINRANGVTPTDIEAQAD
jgi:hypothetical protein